MGSCAFGSIYEDQIRFFGVCESGNQSSDISIGVWTITIDSSNTITNIDSRISGESIIGIRRICGIIHNE